MNSKDALKRVLHSLIYRITVHGGSRLYHGMNPVQSFVANFPPCLQDATIPDPTVSFDTRALLTFPASAPAPSGRCSTSTSYSGLRRATCRSCRSAGLKPELFFDDQVSNQALINLQRRFIEGSSRSSSRTRLRYGNGTSISRRETQHEGLVTIAQNRAACGPRGSQPRRRDPRGQLEGQLGMRRHGSGDRCARGSRFDAAGTCATHRVATPAEA